MSDYYEVLAEPLPKSEDFGFVPPKDWRKRENVEALIAAADAFKRTENYYRWEIAMCEWMIRRLQAEIEHQEGHKDEYAEYVRRNNPHAIRYEQNRIGECLAKIIEIQGGAE